MFKKIMVKLEDDTVCTLYMDESKVPQFLKKVEENKKTDTMITYHSQVESGFFNPNKVFSIAIDDFDINDVEETETK